MSDLAPTLAGVLGVLAVALGVRLAVRSHDRVSYASVLVAVGLLASAVGLSFPVELTSEGIFLLLLPAILFQGTTTLNVRELRHNAGLIAALTLVGLPVSVAVLGLVGTVAFGFGFPGLLFAAVILPTDPAAVLSLFEEFDVTDRLAITIEGESLFNDGVAIVIFASLLAAYRAPGESVTDLATPGGFAAAVGDVAVVGGGGLVFGLLVGYFAHRIVRRTDDTMGLLLTTVVVAYGSFLVAEHYLGLSGVLATVGAGLAMGAHEETHERISDTERSVQTVWTTLSFLVTTSLYVLIGSSVRLSGFVEHVVPVAVAAVLVVLVRALSIYPWSLSPTGLSPIPSRDAVSTSWSGADCTPSFPSRWSSHYPRTSHSVRCSRQWSSASLSLVLSSRALSCQRPWTSPACRGVATLATPGSRPSHGSSGDQRPARTPPYDRQSRRSRWSNVQGPSQRLVARVAYRRAEAGSQALLPLGGT